jgi:hypothetical protein
VFFFPGDMPFSNQDGLTSTFQEKLFREHNTTKYNQMMYINLLSACVSAVTLMCTGHMLPAITFGIEHPRFFVDSAWVLPGFGILASSKVSWSPICREPRSQGTQHRSMVTMIAPKTFCRFAVLSGEDHPPSQLDPNFCSSFACFFLFGCCYPVEPPLDFSWVNWLMTLGLSVLSTCPRVRVGLGS